MSSPLTLPFSIATVLRDEGLSANIPLRQVLEVVTPIYFPDAIENGLTDADHAALSSITSRVKAGEVYADCFYPQSGVPSFVMQALAGNFLDGQEGEMCPDLDPEAMALISKYWDVQADPEVLLATQDQNLLYIYMVDALVTLNEVRLGIRHGDISLNDKQNPAQITSRVKDIYNDKLRPVLMAVRGPTELHGDLLRTCQDICFHINSRYAEAGAAMTFGWGHSLQSMSDDEIADALTIPGRDVNAKFRDAFGIGMGFCREEFGMDDYEGFYQYYRMSLNPLTMLGEAYDADYGRSMHPAVDLLALSYPALHEEKYTFSADSLLGPEITQLYQAYQDSEKIGTIDPDICAQLNDFFTCVQISKIEHLITMRSADVAAAPILAEDIISLYQDLEEAAKAQPYENSIGRRFKASFGHLVDLYNSSVDALGETLGEDTPLYYFKNPYQDEIPFSGLEAANDN